MIKKTTALIKTYTDASQSESTRRSYSQDIRHFRAAGHRIPATPSVVAGYLANSAATLAVATLQHRLVAIHRAHKEAGHSSPVSSEIVKRTMQGIRRTKGVKQRQVRALVKDDLLELLVTVAKQKPLKAARDKALLLVGFAGAFRRSELVALRVEDITPHAHGLEFAIVKSKTDQEGAGRTVFIPLAKSEERCPVRVLQYWLEVAGIGHGALFRPVNRHDKLMGDKQLTPQSVALIVKQAVRNAKGPEVAHLFSGHSMRAGYVTTAAEIGLQPYLIREVTGHRSDVTLAKYIRPIQRRKVPSLL